MRAKEFVGKLEHDPIVGAIRDAEARTSGQIRVYIHRGKLRADPLQAAETKFRGLRMHETQDRNAVLIFVAPRAQRFAVVGDKGIHEKCGDALWQRVAGKMGEHFRNERFSAAIIDAIRDIGSVLAEHFPPQPGRGNELPDDVTGG